MPASTIHYAPSLDLPVDITTERVAYLGRSGSGKTYGAKRLFELLWRAGAQVVAFDAVGVWSGLRRPGKGMPTTVPIFGGRSGDVEIDEHDGRRVAEVIFENHLSAVVDTSLMIDAEMHRFSTDFAERLFDLQRGEPAAMMLMVEECHLVMPQERNDVPTKMLNRWARLVTVGRNFGIGVTMISQRPQAVNKRCLNQAGHLFAYQTTAKLDRVAVRDWFSENVERSLASTVATHLQQLETGEFLYYRAGDAEPQKGKCFPLESADTSSTPKVGGVSRFAEKVAPLDVGLIRSAMAEKAPPEVKKGKQARAEPIRAAFDAGAYEAFQNRAMKWFGEIRTLLDSVEVDFERAFDHYKREVDDSPKPTMEQMIKTVERISEGLHLRREKRQKEQDEAFARGVKGWHSNGDRGPDLSNSMVVNGGETDPEKVVVTPQVDGLSAMASRLLAVLVGDGRAMSLNRAALIAGYSKKSGSVRDAAAELRRQGMVEGGNGDLKASQAGRAAMPSVKKMPSGKRLLDHWFQRLGVTERAILMAVASQHPTDLSLAAAAQRAGYKGLSGSTRDAAAKLRGLGLIVGKNAAMRLAPDLAGG